MKLPLIYLTLWSVSHAAYINRMAVVSNNPGVNPNRIRPTAFRPGVMIRPWMHPRIVQAARVPYVVYRNNPHRYAVKHYTATRMVTNPWKAATRIPSATGTPTSAEFEFLRAQAAAASKAHAGAIHTIPAPNLSLSEKPIVVLEADSNGNTHSISTEAPKPSYEVTETFPDLQAKIEQPIGFSKSPSLTPPELQSLVRNGAALQLASELGLSAIALPPTAIQQLSVPQIQQPAVSTQSNLLQQMNLLQNEVATPTNLLQNPVAIQLNQLQNHAVTPENLLSNHVAAQSSLIPNHVAAPTNLLQHHVAPNFLAHSITPQQFNLQNFHSLPNPQEIMQLSQEGIVITPNALYQPDPAFLQKLQNQLLQRFPGVEFVPYPAEVPSQAQSQSQAQQPLSQLQKSQSQLQQAQNQLQQAQSQSQQAQSQNQKAHNQLQQAQGQSQQAQSQNQKAHNQLQQAQSQSQQAQSQNQKAQSQLQQAQSQSQQAQNQNQNAQIQLHQAQNQLQQAQSQSHQAQNQLQQAQSQPQPQIVQYQQPQPQTDAPIFLLQNELITRQTPSQFVPAEAQNQKNVFLRQTQEGTFVTLVPQMFVTNTTDKQIEITSLTPHNVTVEFIASTKPVESTIKYITESATEEQKSTPIYYPAVTQSDNNQADQNQIAEASQVIQNVVKADVQSNKQNDGIVTPQVQNTVSIQTAQNGGNLVTDNYAAINDKAANQAEKPPEPTVSQENITTTTNNPTSTIKDDLKAYFVQKETKSQNNSKAVTELKPVLGVPFAKAQNSVNVAYTLHRSDDKQAKVAKDGSVYAGQIVEASVSEDQDFNKQKANLYTRRAPLRLLGMTDKNATSTTTPRVTQKVTMVKARIPPKSKLTFDDKTGEPVLRIYASYLDNSAQKEAIASRLSNTKREIAIRNKDSWKDTSTKKDTWKDTTVRALAKPHGFEPSPNAVTEFGQKLRSRSDDVPLFEDYEY